jgi:small-conductance mechanosensitive channel
VLRDADSQLIYVPNSQLTTASITNSGRRSHLRVAGEFALRVADSPKLPQLLAALAAELAQLPQVDQSATPVAVNVSGVRSRVMASSPLPSRANACARSFRQPACRSACPRCSAAAS